MKIRLFMALLIGKAAVVLSRLAGNQGTDFPGRIARRINPAVLSELAGNIKQGIIIVTGTNGKTTTSNIMAAIIQENGSALVHNQEGANLITGITTAFISAAGLFRRRYFDYAILETDEANIPLLLDEIQPRAVLITNFFRDQLDRFGEPSAAIHMIKDALKNKRDIELILNADDPFLSDFEEQTGNKALFFGFATADYEGSTGGLDQTGKYCVICGHELDYRLSYYAQLGKYHCPSCNNKNPMADYTAYDLRMTPEIEFKIDEMQIKSPFQGFYNAYNILAAAATARYLGIDDPVIKNAIMKHQPQAGRMEKFIINGQPCLLILVKNPAGFNQVLTMMTREAGPKNLFIVLNDNAADGRDVSWIWDADAEIIASADTGVTEVICAGLRGADMALRVKYAGIKPDNITIVSDLHSGIQRTLAGEGETAYILCTYSALFECQKILSRMQEQMPAAPPEYQRSKVGSN